LRQLHVTSHRQSVTVYVVAMARGKCWALWAVYFALLGGTTRLWLDDGTHLCTWSFGGVVNY